MLNSIALNVDCNLKASISRCLRLLFAFSWIPVQAFGQAQQAKDPAVGLAIGIVGHTFGFGLNVQATYLRKGGAVVLDLGLTSLKNPKELKIESAYADQGGKDYIFDKKNYVYTFAPTIGISKDWIPKSPFNKMGLKGILSAGPVFAIQKPYFVEVAIPISGNQAYVEVDKYSAAQYNYSNIVGEADFFLGMDELSVVPGFRLKATTAVDFSGSKEYIRTVELGVFCDQYIKAPELMDITPNRNRYIGGSITVLVGNNW